MKDRILEIAVRQMRRGGYENLNFASIAEELSTSRANLHHHFKNKEGLATAATELYIEEQAAGLEDAFNGPDGDISVVLAAIEDYLIELARNVSFGTGCILIQLINDREAPEHLRQLAVNRLRYEAGEIRSLLEKGRVSGKLDSSIDVERLSFRIMSLVLGIPQMPLIETDIEKIISNIRGSLIEAAK